MSAYASRSEAQSAAAELRSVRMQVEHEMSQGYLDVEVTGISFRRLAAAYTALFYGAWSYTLDSVRSLLRPDPAL